VVVSNGNGRVDSLKAWPLEMRRSATTQQRGTTRRIEDNNIAQSRKEWFLLCYVILADKELAVGVEWCIVVDLARPPQTPGPQESCSKVEALELANYG
jgi:hypothetical protein